MTQHQSSLDVSPLTVPEHSTIVSRDGGDADKEHHEDPKNNNSPEKEVMLVPLEAQMDAADQEEEGEEIYGIPEAVVPKELPDPQLPHPSEVATHNITHNPYRSWCPFGVAAAGREDAHRTGARDTDGEDKIPTICFDYDFFGDSGRRIDEEKVEAATDAIAMIIKDIKSGAIWAHSVECKGPKDKWMIKRFIADIESTGYSHIRLKADGEPSTKAVQKEIIAQRPPPRRTIPVNPPSYDPLANGAIEVGVKEFNVQMRKIKLCLEAHIKEELGARHPLVEWLIEHAAYLLTHTVIHADGKTSYERMTGRKFRGKLVEFGEQVLAKLVKPKPRSKPNASRDPSSFELPGSDSVSEQGNTW